MPDEEIRKLFLGAVTVGERGQVVIPAEARECLDIRPGDKLLVFKHPAGWGVAFAKVERIAEAQQELQRLLMELPHEPREEGPAEEGMQ